MTTPTQPDTEARELRRLDALVAEHIMGCRVKRFASAPGGECGCCTCYEYGDRVHNGPCLCPDHNAFAEVLEELGRREYLFNYVLHLSLLDGQDEGTAFEAEAARAVAPLPLKVRAALAACGVEVEEGKAG